MNANRLHPAYNPMGAPRPAADHPPGTLRHYGCDIIENVRLAANPLVLGDQVIRLGYEVLYNGINPIPAQPFFLSAEDAQRAIDLVVRARRIDAWWRLAHETGLDAFAGGPMLYRGYRISQRIVHTGETATNWTYARGFEVFLPPPYDFRTLLPPGNYFESLAEAADAVDLHVDGDAFNAAFYRLTNMVNPDGMVPHGASLLAQQIQNMPVPPAVATGDVLVLDAVQTEAPKFPEPALDVEGDYRGFIYLVWADETKGGELFTRVWSSEQELILIDLTGVVSFATVKAVVDTYYIGLDRKESGEDLAPGEAQGANE